MNQKWSRDKELQASGCKLTWSDGLIPSAALLTLSQKQFCWDPGIDGSRCNKEGISPVQKMAKDRNC